MSTNQLFFAIIGFYITINGLLITVLKWYVDAKFDSLKLYIDIRFKFIEENLKEIKEILKELQKDQRIIK